MPSVQPNILVNDEELDIAYSMETIPEVPAGNMWGQQLHGLSMCTAAVFIIGEIAGAGVLALPLALAGTGLIGAALMTFVCLASIYTGILLGKSWVIVQQRYPDEYKEQVRDPYPSLGQVTYGKKGRVLVSVCINISLYGATVVFMIMAAQNTHDLLHRYTEIPFCYWLLVVAGVLAPLSWLGTPKDFWFFAVTATAATVIASIILLTDMILDIPHHVTATHESPSFESFATAFGTMLFAFGGHPAFPTFQADMRIQRHFQYSVSTAYACILVLYLAISLSGYLIYGSNVAENVLLSMSKGPMLTVIESLITCHLLFAYVIVINPVCQQLEEVCKIPTHFTWKRIVSRTFLVGIGLVIAETIPRFGAVLSLVGGSTTNILAYVLPMVFYSKLCNMEGDWPSISIPLHHKVLNYEIMAVGVLGGIASTYAAIVSIVSPNSLTVPCFINITSH